MEIVCCKSSTKNEMKRYVAVACLQHLSWDYGICLEDKWVFVGRKVPLAVYGLCLYTARDGVKNMKNYGTIFKKI